MARSPLRYPGGKSRALKRIRPLIPDFNEYREPFVGGGSVFLKELQNKENGFFWINDKYEPIYQFWSNIVHKGDEVVQSVEGLFNEFDNGKELFEYLRSTYNSSTEIDKAAFFFVLNRITFSGIGDSGGFSQESFDKRFTRSSVDRLKTLSDLFEGDNVHRIKITNEDYERSIMEKGDNVFIFLDPPYFSTTNSALYGNNGDLHKNFDHERFASIMKECEHNYLITYDDCERIRELFSFAPYIVSWDASYGMRNVVEGSEQTGKELFISNYPIEHVH